MEFVRFTVAESDVDTFLARRQEAIGEVKSAHPELWSVPLCSLREDGTWIDVWIYTSKQAADAANADVENLPRFRAMVELLDNLEIEATDMPEQAKSDI
ncbi:hypothetical protein FB384_003474 [Prauserella sediminis]|uniref:ABM domain-containing protein n=1 Tax=Prauserella sediminis TaxID=577680 RepID=A0A839XMS7_9PSEU|nr:hypothetical protein [Prauserella sediminis]MBB3664570.1 hypothetical protein [Prauserella sediminis]